MDYRCRSQFNVNLDGGGNEKDQEFSKIPMRFRKSTNQMKTFYR
jgi:hypothetical protein